MPSGKPIEGINDLVTLFSDLAVEADGWDPSTVTFSAHKNKSWKCRAHRHTWNDVSVNQRTAHVGRGCPFCIGKRVWSGFNDLKTKFPEIAKETNDRDDYWKT